MEQERYERFWSRFCFLSLRMKSKCFLLDSFSFIFHILMLNAESPGYFLYFVLHNNCKRPVQRILCYICICYYYPRGTYLVHIYCIQANLRGTFFIYIFTFMNIDCVQMDVCLPLNPSDMGAKQEPVGEIGLQGTVHFLSILFVLCLSFRSPDTKATVRVHHIDTSSKNTHYDRSTVVHSKPMAHTKSVHISFAKWRRIFIWLYADMMCVWYIVELRAVYNGLHFSHYTMLGSYRTILRWRCTRSLCIYI